MSSRALAGSCSLAAVCSGLLAGACGGSSGTRPMPTQTQTPPLVAASTSAVPAVALAQPSALPSEPVVVDPEEAVVDANPTSEGAPAALYADLFEPGAAWTASRAWMTATTKVSDVPQVQRGTEKLRCAVQSVEKRPWAWVSVIACPGLEEKLAGPDPLDGYWAATALGLFHFAEDPGRTPPALIRARLVLRPDPKPEHVERVDPDSRFGPAWSAATERSGGAWCGRQQSAAGDMTAQAACFEPGRGFVRAETMAVLGSTVRQDTLTLVRTKRGRPR